MIVMKFGGTSIADAVRIRRVAEIIRQAQPVLVVLSAFAGTTDQLTRISTAFKTQNLHLSQQLISELKQHYEALIANLFVAYEYQEKAIKFIETQFKELIEIVDSKYLLSTELYILAQGEIFSTILFKLYLEEIGERSCLINALDVLRLDENFEPDANYIKTQLSVQLERNTTAKIWITQGYICRNAFGEIANLKRGGSDYSASLFAAAIEADELQIWTDIDGIHNNDPRFVKNTTSIKELSFDEAAELAYFGAKILHPASIRPARKANIPVKLLNSLQPEVSGTLISTQTNQSRIKAIAAKDGITAIKIRSSEMLQAPGFLRRIFEVFELYKTSIDMITTSEVAVSVTIDDQKYLQNIIKTLQEFGHVEVDLNLSIICVVGDFLVDSKGIAAQVIKAVENIPLRMISYGGSAHNISILVNQSLKVKAINELQKGLFHDKS